MIQARKYFSVIKELSLLLFLLLVMPVAKNRTKKVDFINHICIFAQLE